MNNIIINTIGNRDLQIEKEDYNNFEDSLKQKFQINNDNENYYFIHKREKNFLETSKYLYENYDRFFKVFKFPIIEKGLEYLMKKGIRIDKIVFVGTKQKEIDKQDTYYIGLICKKYFNDYDVELRFIEKDPTNFGDLVKYFIELLDFYGGENIYVNYSGGTPQMRSSLLSSGIFRENISFLELNSRTKKIVIENFVKQREILLKDKIKDMLKVYDFEGVRNLPVEKEIKKLCEEALDYYNFKKGVVGDSYYSKSKEAIKLLWSNLYVCYVQSRFSEVIGRIFRIEEQVWYFLFYNFLKKENLINKKDTIKRKDSKGNVVYKDKFSSLIKNVNIYGKNFFYFHFKEIFEEKEGTIFFKNENLNLNLGKNTYYYFFKNLDLYQEIREFFEKLNVDDKGNYYQKDSRLNSLRNSSINGHGFNGISKEDIENVINIDLEDFLLEFKKTLEEYVLGENFQNIFDNYVSRIINIIEDE